MSDSECQPQSPTAEHAELMTHVGTWDVVCKYFMEPGKPPMELPAVETVDALGEYFVVSLFEADFGGAPFQGRATLGFDTYAGEWVSTWVDSMSSFLFCFKGQKKGEDELEMRAQGPLPGGTTLTNYRTLEKRVDADQRSFDMWFEMVGVGEVLLAHYDYTRRK